MISMSANRPEADTAGSRQSVRYVPLAEVAMPVVGAVHSINNGSGERASCNSLLGWFADNHECVLTQKKLAAYQPQQAINANMSCGGASLF